jgi:polyphosphate kinase
MADAPYTQNRELSWLRFNDRVLSEATDETVPLLERLKFVSIFTSNLDEFFMIRVGSLFDLDAVNPQARDPRSGWTPGRQLEEIYGAVRPLYEKRQRICAQLETQLRAHGICRLEMEELTPPEQKFVRQYFKSAVAPILSPQIVDAHHPFPHLKNKVIHVGAWVRYRSREVLALCQVPESLPPVLFLPGAELRYIHMENILLAYLDQVFPNYTILEKAAFCVTRNADVNPEDEAFELEQEDFRKRMRKVLRQRLRMAPVRLELSCRPGEALLGCLRERLPVRSSQVFVTAAPLKLEYAFSLAGRLPEARRGALTYPPHRPCIPPDIHMDAGLIRQVERKDRLLSFPFESMAPFLALLQEAARDPSVLSIKITIYRLAGKARLVDCLCQAAENGKEVTVLIELRARFDEQNNIDWSERLEDAGCTVLYGFESYKVHSKVCLITRREHGEIRYITQIGTGNYNEKTAEQYTDLSLITADPGIGQDASDFFRNMAIANLEGEYRWLLAAPSSLKPRLLALMDREIEKGGEGYICIKINSITDMDLIEKLREASRAGVEVRMIVRGICCILPGVPGETDHIRITSIVGRFLEHSRIYVFGRGSQEQMYISSADFMTRNTQRRVEVAVPILDPDVREKIRKILETCLGDTAKARQLMPDGTYAPVPRTGEPLDSQQQLLLQAIQAEGARAPGRPAAPLHRFRTFLGKFFS